MRAACREFKAWVDSQFDPRMTWNDLAWVRDNWPGKILLKGILDVDDAREAAAAGVDGIVVSNHGGRQLDGVAASIDALPRIVDAVGDTLEVLMDGGVRSGLDVVKALALGARACMLGRAWGYAVAARGEAGVAHMLSVMRKEIEGHGAVRRNRCAPPESRNAARPGLTADLKGRSASADFSAGLNRPERKGMHHGGHGDTAQGNGLACADGFAVSPCPPWSSFPDCFLTRIAARMPCIKASGVGGQPGMRRSTPITFSMAPQLA